MYFLCQSRAGMKARYISQLFEGPILANDNSKEGRQKRNKILNKIEKLKNQPKTGLPEAINTRNQ
eukprot:UN02184